MDSNTFKEWMESEDLTSELMKKHNLLQKI